MLIPDNILQIIIVFGAFLALISFILAIFALIRQRKIRKNLETLFSGKQAQDLESILLAQTKEICQLDKEI